MKEPFNYDESANVNDDSCCFVSGCTNPDALNYNQYACYDDGSCVAIIEGCTIPSMFNYNPDANVNDGSCYPFIYGCLDENACNYIPPTGIIQWMLTQTMTHVHL